MKLELDRGRVVTVDGPARVRILSGKVEVVGARVSQFEVPRGKRLPVEALAKTRLDIDAPAGSVEEVTGRTIPASWDRFVARMKKERPKSVFVLGEMDTGKSFFATYVANRLLAGKRKVAVLDLDIGQSDVGPPGCFGLAVLKKPVSFLPQAPVTATAFVGGHSPALHFAPALAAFARISRRAAAAADTVLVNTSGWVQGDGGRAYKAAKMEIFPPDLVVLIQRDGELEHLVRHLPERKIVRLHVSKAASNTPPEVRKGLREEVSRAYFAGAKTVRVRGFATQGAYYGTGTPVAVPRGVAKYVRYAEKLSGWEGHLVVHKDPLPPSARREVAAAFPGRIVRVPEGFEAGVVVGLADSNGDGLGEGVLLALDWKRRVATIRTPVPADKIRILQFGSLRLTPDGEEDGFVAPGSL